MKAGWYANRCCKDHDRRTYRAFNKIINGYEIELYGVWCDARLLNSAVQKVFDKLVESMFRIYLLSFVTYLCHQFKLSFTMKLYCSVFALNRWMFLCSICKLVDKTWTAVKNVLDTKNLPRSSLAASRMYLNTSKNFLLLLICFKFIQDEKNIHIRAER